MPQGGRAIKVPKGCENCGNDAFDIVWKDGFGLKVPLERHCNQCGWAIDLETKEIRNPGRKLGEMRSSMSGEKK